MAPQKVSFRSHGMRIAALLHLPPNGTPNRRGAAIVIGHPWASTKEQAPANYARMLNQDGFICLTFDAAHQGESEGEPRELEDPYQRVEDFKSAVTFLHTRKEVDPARIGFLGICASGGYVVSAAQTDRRVRAVATVAAVCVSTMARMAYQKNTPSPETLRARLEAASRNRNSISSTNSGNGSVRLKAEPLVHHLPERFEEVDGLPLSFQDLVTCNRTPRTQNPRAPSTSVARSWDLMANFNAFAYTDMISPRPLLMITGTKATTRWYSEEAVDRAGKTAELVVIDGLTHADFYDHLDEVGPKCTTFFRKNLM